MSYWNLVVSGGPVMWIIVFLSVAAVFIFLAKWFQFHRAQVDVRELVTGLVNVLKRDSFIEAITLCDNTPGPVARMLGCAIKACQNGDDINQAINDSVLVEIPRMERSLNILATIAKIAPMLGLLGTVIGMGETFLMMQTKQGLSITLGELSGGVGMALATTGAGLCVAIPSYMGYNYLVSRMESFCVDMEKASSEIVYFFKRHRSKRRSDEN